MVASVDKNINIKSETKFCCTQKTETLSLDFAAHDKFINAAAKYKKTNV